MNKNGSEFFLAQRENSSNQSIPTKGCEKREKVDLSRLNFYFTCVFFSLIKCHGK